MAEPNLQNNGWISVPWALYTGRGAGSESVDGAFAHGSSGNQGTFSILVNWQDVHTAVWDLLGECFFSPGTGLLTRIPPKLHPFHNWLYCTRVVSIKPMVFDDKEHYVVGPWGRWRFAVLTLLFQQLKYPVMSDNGLDARFPPVTIDTVSYRQEWQRYVEWTEQPGTETLSVEAGSYKFAEGTGVGGQPLAGTTVFNSPTGVHLGKDTIIATWRQVPYYGLFSPTTFRAERLIAARNSVNFATFRGNPPGTMRFDGWSFTFNEAPYPSNIVGIGNDGPEQVWPSLTVDVQLIWSRFDPPNGGAARGHNLAPYRPDPTGKWYLVTTGGGALEATIYPYHDHRTIFRAAGLP